MSVFTETNLCTDPGDVPFEDESGIRYWLSSTGEKLSEDPNSHAYNWVEYYSEDLQRTYYYNQVRTRCGI